MTRREFLKTGICLTSVASGLEILPRYAATETPKERITSAQKESGCKIYPSQEGCFVGFYREQNRRFRLGKEISTTIDHYRNALGAKPAILAFWTFLDLGFPMIEAETMKENGIMPLVSIMPGHERWKPSFGPDDIVKGRCDKHIKGLAAGTVRFGEKHGGFFFTTMVESNASWWVWSRKPETTPAWRYIWQIFEDQGANRYATWIWEAFCPERYRISAADPEPYYPGDEYLDWIGINVFANLKNPYIRENTRFSELMSKTYEQMLGNHPQKPVMVSEFGRTPGDNQPLWLIDAFRSIKDDYPPIKAAIYYDNITGVLTGQDHTLDQRSLGTLKEIFKDPYWIMARK